jgi:pentatricopeptide repeat protein
MEAKYVAGDTDLKPNTYTYNAVISALAKSGETGAAARAERVLQNMVNRQRVGGSDAVKPTTIKYVAIERSPGYVSVNITNDLTPVSIVSLTLGQSLVVDVPPPNVPKRYLSGWIDSTRVETKMSDRIRFRTYLAGLSQRVSLCLDLS